LSQTENISVFQYAQLPHLAQYLLYYYLSCKSITFKD